MDSTLTQKEILVTIGIPMYNAERFLRKTLASVLNQTYSNFELIITDDGSTDASVNIVKSFDDPRIQLIADGENHGISFRLNQQINLAKGKYFVRMDADDIMFPQRLEKQISYLENNPDVDVVGSSAVIIDDDNKVIGYRNSMLPPTYEGALKIITFIHPTIAGKIEWFKKYGYNENLNGAEDFDLWLRSRNQSNFRTINEPLIYYRDPLKFKLKTYLFRLVQQRKIFRTDPLLQKKTLLRNKTILFSHLKSIFAKAISFMGLDDRYIVMRNIQASSSELNLQKYQIQLDEFFKH